MIWRGNYSLRFVWACVVLTCCTLTSCKSPAAFKASKLTAKDGVSSELRSLKQGLWVFNSSASITRRCIEPIKTLKQMAANSDCQIGTVYRISDSTYQFDLACDHKKGAEKVSFDVEVVNPDAETVHWFVRDRTLRKAIVGDVAATRLGECSDEEVQQEASLYTRSRLARYTSWQSPGIHIL